MSAASRSGTCQYRFSKRIVKSFATVRITVSAKRASRSASGGNGRWASQGSWGATTNRSFHNGTQYWSRKRFASARLSIPSTRISLTRRSCAVPKLRSTRPFACGEPARINSTPSLPRPRAMIVSVRRPFAVLHCPKWPAWWT